jgi:ribonuclease HI
MASVQEHPKGFLQAIPHYPPSPYNASSQSNVDQALPQSNSSLPSLHPFYSHLLRDLSLEDHQGRAIASSIQKGTLIACCDGSFDPITRRAAYGLVLADSEDKIHLLKLRGPCVGHANGQSAIRAELISITASTYLLLSLLSKFGVTGGSLSLYNDCSKALKLINQQGHKFKRFLINDYDLINEIRTTLHHVRSSVSIQLLWVKGHYSGKNREPQHDLNADARSLATSGLAIASQSSVDISPPFIPS